MRAVRENRYWQAALRVLQRHRRPYLTLNVLAPVDALLSGGALYLVKRMVDSIPHLDGAPQILGAIVPLLAAVLLQGGLDVWVAYVQSKVTAGIVAQAQSDLFRVVSAKYHELAGQKDVGRVVTEFESSTGAYANVVNVFGASLLRQVLTAATFLGAMLYLDGWLTAVALVMLPIVALPLSYMAARLRRYGRVMLNFKGRTIHLLHEVLIGNEVVLAFNMQQGFAERYDRENRTVVDSVVRSAVWTSLASPLNNIAGLIGVLLLLPIGIGRMRTGAMSEGDLVALLLAIFRFYGQIKGLSILHNGLQHSIPGFQQVVDAIGAPAAPVGRPRTTLAAFRERIELVDVGFSYAGGRTVLRRVNLTVRKGDKIAILGETGSGKSTLARLLLGFLPPERGRVLIDATDYADVAPESLHRLIAYVPQEVVLFRDTLRNNITCREAPNSDARLAAAARSARIEGFVARLPAGLETELGDLGHGLSKGEQQRITIARALYKNADIFVFDEATSAIDLDTEAALWAELMAAGGDKTMIVFTHRTSVVGWMDRVYQLSGGALVELDKASPRFGRSMRA